MSALAPPRAKSGIVRPIIVVFSLALWAAVGALTRRLVFWAPDTLADLPRPGDP